MPLAVDGAPEGSSIPDHSRTSSSGGPDVTLAGDGASEGSDDPNCSCTSAAASRASAKVTFEKMPTMIEPGTVWQMQAANEIINGSNGDHYEPLEWRDFWAWQVLVTMILAFVGNSLLVVAMDNKQHLSFVQFQALQTAAFVTINGPRTYFMVAVFSQVHGGMWYWFPCVAPVFSVTLDCISYTFLQTSMAGEAAAMIGVALAFCVVPGRRKLALSFVVLGVVFQFIASYAVDYLPHVMHLAPEQVKPLLFPAVSFAYKGLLPQLFTSAWMRFGAGVETLYFSAVFAFIYNSADAITIVGLVILLLDNGGSESKCMESIMIAAFLRALDRVTAGDMMALARLILCRDPLPPLSGIRGLRLRVAYAQTFTPSLLLMPFLMMVMWATLGSGDGPSCATWVALAVSVIVEAITDGAVLAFFKMRFRRRASSRRSGTASLGEPSPWFGRPLIRQGNLTTEQAKLLPLLCAFAQGIGAFTILGSSFYTFTRGLFHL